MGHYWARAEMPGHSEINTSKLLMIPVLEGSHMWVECSERVGSHSRPGVGDGSQQRGLPSVRKSHLMAEREKSVIIFYMPTLSSNITSRFPPVRHGPWCVAPAEGPSPRPERPGSPSLGHDPNTATYSLPCSERSVTVFPLSFTTVPSGTFKEERRDR